MVVNPPYGERLVLDNLLNVYKELGSRLKHAFQGNEAWIISSSYDCFDQVGLKASARIPLYNGDLDCEFRKYELFQGKYKGFRDEGNELKKEFAPLKRKSRLTGLDGEQRPSRREREEDSFSADIDGDSMRRRRELESYFGTMNAKRIVAGRERKEYGKERPQREDRKNGRYEDRQENRYGNRKETRGDDRRKGRNGYGNRERNGAPRDRYERRDGAGKRQPSRGNGDFKPLRGGKRDNKRK